MLSSDCCSNRKLNGLTIISPPMGHIARDDSYTRGTIQNPESGILTRLLIKVAKTRGPV